jgi:hypothetical protein
LSKARRRKRDARRWYPCLLCRASALGLGIYAPNERGRELMGLPRGTERIIVYPLCERCVAAPDWLAQVERVIFARLATPERN